MMLSNAIWWLHTYNPSPVLATIGHFTIYWYGFFYTISIALVYWLVWRILQQYSHSNDQRLTAYGSTALRLMASLPEFAFGLVVSGLVGARIYHVLNEWTYYWTHPLRIFAIWNGGLAIHGALIAGLIFLWFYSKHQATSNKLQANAFLWLADLLSPAVLLGQAIGRWGNYFNQELFGYPTSLPWGIPISPANRPPEFANFTYFHPTFLYESLWDFVGFIILFILQRQLIAYVPREVPLRGMKWSSLWLMAYGPKRTARPGFIFSIYLIWTSVGRIFVEFLRIDQVPLIYGLRWPLIVSAILLLLSLSFLTLTPRNEQEYT